MLQSLRPDVELEPGTSSVSDYRFAKRTSLLGSNEIAANPRHKTSMFRPLQISRTPETLGAPDWSFVGFWVWGAWGFAARHSLRAALYLRWS